MTGTETPQGNAHQSCWDSAVEEEGLVCAAYKHHTLLCSLRAQLGAGCPAVVTGAQLHWGLLKPKHSLVTGRKAQEQPLS